MAPVTAHLLALKQDISEDQFKGALKETRRLPDDEAALLWAAQCHHWIHEPQLSQSALTGTGPTLTRWDYIVALAGSTAQTLPPPLATLTRDTWSISFDAAEPLIDTDGTKLKELHSALSTSSPALPEDWSPANLAGLDNGRAPSDLVLSLNTKSPLLGRDKTSSLTPLRAFTRSFVTGESRRPGPVVMFNLLSFLPSQMPQYMNYVSGFLQDMSPRYGPQPLIYGFGSIADWSSRAGEQDQGEGEEEGAWEGVGIIWYPSLLHFAKMLDDEDYAHLDRTYKVGVVRDNALMCCTSVEFGEL